MRADRAVAGLTAVVVLLTVAHVLEEPTAKEGAILGVAILVLVLTFAPVLPILHALPRIGAPRVSVNLSFERERDGGGEELVVRRDGEHAPEKTLRVGFSNDGPRRVSDVVVNVIVPETVEISACDVKGDTDSTHGRAMPLTEVDGRRMRFWADDELTLPKGGRLLFYELRFPKAEALGGGFPVRVQYDSDDLYGGERVYEQQVRVVDLVEAGAPAPPA
jgi:hypothetical protein